MAEMSLGTSAARLLRTERMLAKMRWAAAVFALFQVLTYYKPYPHGVFPVAVGFAILLFVGSAGVTWLATRVRTDAGVRALAIGSLVLDGVVLVGITLSYTWDTDAAVWAVLYILPLDAAAHFQMRGALLMMTGVTLALAAREIYAHVAFHYPLLANSITFRAGIGFVIAGAAGAMSTAERRLREQVQQLRIEIDEAHVAKSAAEITESDYFLDLQRKVDQLRIQSEP